MLVVTQQSDNLFRAEISYDDGANTHTEKVVGSVAMDGRTFYYAGDDGLVHGVINSATSIDTCYIETGDDAQVACGTLTKTR